MAFFAKTARGIPMPRFPPGSGKYLVFMPSKALIFALFRIAGLLILRRPGPELGPVFNSSFCAQEMLISGNWVPESRAGVDARRSTWTQPRSVQQDTFFFGAWPKKEKKSAMVAYMHPIFHVHVAYMHNHNKIFQPNQI